MSAATDVIGAALIIAGVLLLAISAVGLVRFPDFYTRSHAVAKSETMGLLLVLVGLLVHLRLGAGSAQLGFIALFSFLVNPTAMHALARTAARRGLAPWKRPEP